MSNENIGVKIIRKFFEEDFIKEVEDFVNSNKTTSRSYSSYKHNGTGDCVFVCIIEYIKSHP